MSPQLFNLETVPAAAKESTDSSMRFFANDDGDGPFEILLMEEIGEDGWGGGMAATDLVNRLSNNKHRDINLRINSPGGLVYDGLVMYNALASHPQTVNVTIEGLAYSAASFVAMAGDVVTMYEASDIGIHNAWGGAIGNARAMQSVADWLTTIDEHLYDIYSAKSGQTRDWVKEMMRGVDDGTVFSAKEALEFGLVDAVIPLKETRQAAKKQAPTAKIPLKRIHAANQLRIERAKRRA